MANYPKEFDDLLQEYLTDGIITVQERKVLLRKAEKLGLDVEEIDLYITAQEQKVEQATDAAVRKKKGQTCPYCGGSVPQLADQCPHCGQHITVEASDELKEIIENLEEALVDLKDSKNFERSKAQVERYARKARMYYSNNPKIKPLLEEVEAEMVITEKKHRNKNAWYRVIFRIIVGIFRIIGDIFRIIGDIFSGIFRIIGDIFRYHPYMATYILLIVAAILIYNFIYPHSWILWSAVLGGGCTIGAWHNYNEYF